MAGSVCPWWIGPVIASPLRKVRQNPYGILAPWVKRGMTVLEPGPGMGFFTIPLADLVGENGRVVSVDVQRKMLEGLVRRTERKGLSDRVEARLCDATSLGLEMLHEQVDFALAFAVVHEVPESARFLAEIHAALRPGGLLMIAEPSSHVAKADFEREITVCRKLGMEEVARPRIQRSNTVVLAK